MIDLDKMFQQKVFTCKIISPTSIATTLFGQRNVECLQNLINAFGFSVAPESVTATKEILLVHVKRKLLRLYNVTCYV